FCGGSFRKLDGSTGLLDLFDSCLGGACRFDRDLCLQLAIRKDAYAVLDATDNAGGLESSGIDSRLGVELLGIDRSLDTAERNGDVFRCEDVVEATLRQATIDRHLAALEAVDGNAGARLLALDAATTGLALAGTDTATDADTVVGGTVFIFDFVQFHDDFLRLTCRRRGQRDAGPNGSRREPKGYPPGCEKGASCCGRDRSGSGVGRPGGGWGNR